MGFREILKLPILYAKLAICVHICIFFLGRKSIAFIKFSKELVTEKRPRPQMALEQHPHLTAEETEAQRESNLLIQDFTVSQWQGLT